MDSIVGKSLPSFKLNAATKGEFSSIDNGSLKGKWSILLFYPLDFTFVCPTEIVAYDNAGAQFDQLGAKVFGVSVDSHFAHRVYQMTPRADGGVQGIQMPLIADLGGSLARALGVLTDAGIALRALLLVDPDGVVQHMTINNLSVGRNVEETLRLLEAFQFTKANGDVCPANWKAGAKTMKPNFDGLKSYMKDMK